MAKSTKSVWSSYKKQYNKSQNQWKKMTGFPTQKKKSFYDNYSITKTFSSKSYKSKKVKPININTYVNWEDSKGKPQNNGCYIATCVYGSYDCPQVWVLRRFRDNTLADTQIGRTLIRIYYGVSPILVRIFGNTLIFKRIWRGILDIFVSHLKKKGVEDTEYFDD